MTLATRLKLTAILCALLTIAVCQALFQAHTYQQKIYKQLNHSMQIQLSIDSLRSQLWLYEEYSDQLSLSELNIRQADLAVQLSKDIQWHTKQRRVLDNLNRLNANIRVLFNTQMESNTNHSLSEHQLTSSRLLKAKYSMNIEKMTEDMYRLHKVTIAQAKQTQQSLLISVSLVVLLLSILVTMWSSMTLIRFKRGMKSLNDGMRTLANGDLESRVKYDMNDEFAEMSDNFNDMKASLQKITIKKEELKSGAYDQIVRRVPRPAQRPGRTLAAKRGRRGPSAHQLRRRGPLGPFLGHGQHTAHPTRTRLPAQLRRRLHPARR